MVNERYRLVPVDYDEFLIDSRSKLPYGKIISEFADSDADTVEVQFDDDLNRRSICMALRSALNRSGAPIKAYMRRGKVYLVKKQED